MQFSTLSRFCGATLIAGLVATSGLFAQNNPPSNQRCFKDESGTYRDVTGRPCLNAIVTAVPFLTLDPSAHNGAMGDVGVALSPSANSIAFNASAIAFSESPGEIQATYTPWLQALNLDDVFVAYLSGYGKLGELQSFYGSVRYFSYGNIDYTDQLGEAIASGKPYEFAVDLGYTRKLSENWAASITGRYILSSLANGLTVPGSTSRIKNAHAGAADIGVSYRRELAIGNGALLRAGMAVSNIGTKITYTDATAKDYLPTNLALGSSVQFGIDDYNSITVALDFNKLLVPSPQIVTEDVDPQNGRPDHLDKSPIEGIVSSFGDAPGGFSEELQEINTSIGLEYWYGEQFAARAGYFYEPATKGGRKYVTFGAGLRYNVFSIDVSYIVPTSAVRTPLDNTLRFTFGYSFQDSDYGYDEEI